MCVGMSVSRKGCWCIILEGCRFRARNHCLGWRELGKQVAYGKSKVWDYGEGLEYFES